MDGWWPRAGPLTGPSLKAVRVRSWFSSGSRWIRRSGVSAGLRMAPGGPVDFMRTGAGCAQARWPGVVFVF